MQLSQAQPCEFHIDGGRDVIWQMRILSLTEGHHSVPPGVVITQLRRC